MKSGYLTACAAVMLAILVPVSAFAQSGPSLNTTIKAPDPAPEPKRQEPIKVEPQQGPIKLTPQSEPITVAPHKP